MDALMTARRPNNDYESRFFELLMKRLDSQDRKLDDIHTQTKLTNGRVTKLEHEVYEPQKKDLPPILTDPRVIYIAGVIILLALAVAAAALGVDVGSLL